MDGSRKAYDAIYLDRCLKARLITDVASITYQFLKLPAQLNQMTFSFKSLQIPKDFEPRAIAFEANNYHACCSNDAPRERSASCQFVFGHFLKKRAADDEAFSESIRWLQLASVNGCKLADIELSELED